MQILKTGISKEKGITLIELVVAIAIIAFMFGVVVIAYNGSDANLKDFSAKLQGTIRYTYNEAAIKGLYYRLRINLDEQTIQVESTELNSILSFLDSKHNEESSQEQKKEEDALSEEEKTAEDTAKQNAFVAENSFLLKPLKLPSSIKIKDVFVEHEETKVENGEVSIYFFPQGWVEKTVINLCNEDESKCYSVEVFSPTAKSKIREEYYELQNS